MSAATIDRPYPGPRPFEVGDRSCFFGRDGEVADLTSLVISHRVVLLYAQSGAGKTSLLNAALIPSLEQEGFEMLPTVRVRGLVADDLATRAHNIFVLNTLVCWSDAGVDRGSLVAFTIPDYLKTRPHPADVDGYSKPYLMIFDQFEELFAFYPERWREREEFFEQVSDALQNDPLIHALFVMREDYAASLDPYARLMPGRFDTRFRLERLRPHAARAAAEGPLEQTPRRFAPNVAENLVDQLLAIRVEDAGGRTKEVKGEYVEPVQLQIACESLWNELPPEVTVITDEHLRTFGDVNQALSEFYEATLQRTVVETGVSEDALRDWFDNRLITSSGTRGTVFRGPDSTEGIPNRAVDFLENRHLIRAEMRAGGRWYELTHDRFIRPMKTSNDEWRMKALRARMRTRRRRVATIAAVIVLFVVAGAVAITSRQAAIQRQTRSLELAANALLPTDNPEDSMCLALAAAELGGPNEAAKIESALRQALRASRVRRVFNAEGPILATLFAPGDKWLVATAGKNNTLIISDVASGQSASIGNHGAELEAVAFSADGELVAMTTVDGAVHVSASSGESLFSLAEQGQFFTRPKFSADGKIVLTAGSDGSVQLWDVALRQRYKVLGGGGSQIMAAAFSPDGARVVTAGDDGKARIFDVDSQREVIELIGHRDSLTDARFGPDGSRVLTASRDSTARVWDAGNGATLAELRGHAGQVYAAAFSPDGDTIVTAGDDGTARTWVTATGAPIATLRGHSQTVLSAAFNRNGRQVVTASSDRSARLWDVGEGWLAAMPRRAGVNRVTFSADGRQVLTAGPDSATHAADARTGQSASSEGAATAFEHGADSEDKFTPNPRWKSSTGDQQRLLATSPDGTLLLTVSGTVATVRRAKTDEVVRELTGHKEHVIAGAFSAEGRRVATGSFDTTRVWELDGSGRVTVLAHPDEIDTVAFPRAPSSSENFLLTTSRNGTARVWDVDGAATVMELNGPVPLGAAFSPDGQLVATARENGAIATYHCETCAPLATLRELARKRLGSNACAPSR